MTALDRILRKARRRIILDRALACAALGLLGGLAAALAVLMVDRLAAFGWPWMVFAAVPVAGLIAGLVWAVIRAPSLDDVAVRIDRALQLKDRIGTAEAIERGLVRESELVELARRDAEQYAERLDVRSATPITITRAWLGVVPAIAGLAIAVMYLPEFAFAKSQPQMTAEEEQALDEARQSAARALEEALDDLADDDEALAGASPEERDLLAELAEQLRRDDLSPQEFRESRDRSAERLNDLAHRAEERAERDQRMLDELNRRFAGLEAPQPEEGKPALAEELREALREGDYARAADVVERMTEALDQMSEAERQALAEALRELSREIEEQAPSAEDPQMQAEEQTLEEALRDQGLDDETIDELANEESREGAQRRLEEEGVDREVADQLARALQEQRQERAAGEEAQERAREIADDLNELSDEVEEREATGGEQRSQEQQQREQRQGDETRTGDEQKGASAQTEKRSGEQRETASEKRTGEAQTDERQPREKQGEETTEEPQSEPCPDCQGES